VIIDDKVLLYAEEMAKEAKLSDINKPSTTG
jgi:hypothetical protein